MYSYSTYPTYPRNVDGTLRVSGYTKRRAEEWISGLARSIAVNPGKPKNYWYEFVMDRLAKQDLSASEMTVGLSPEEKQCLYDALRRLKQQGVIECGERGSKYRRVL